MKKILTVTALALLIVFSGLNIKAEEIKTAKVGQMAPDFTLTDANGKKHSLSDFKGKYVVLEWINFGCPFVVKHYGAGNMQMLQEKYTAKEVIWLTICSSAPGLQGYFEGEELLNQIKEHNVKSSAYLIDADGKVGMMYEAKTTPNMYIINPEGSLVYAGAIDDKATPNPDDIKSSLNYVSTALDQVMVGKEITTKVTQPYGCGVKYAKK